MLFNTLQFLVFFIIVYVLYLNCQHKWQNRILLVASYIFYASWDVMFLSLIFISTIIDYICGIQIHDSTSNRRRKIFLSISIVGNLLILGYFKYFNFFSSSFSDLVGLFGYQVNINTLNVVLPVGISFYTFQSMSYSIDIYRKDAKVTRNIFDFALYVAFFPQLVAGPIERASRLLPQMLKPRKPSLEDFYSGCFLIFWGMFQKIFVADNLAGIVDPIFASSGPYSGHMVLIAAYAFTFQIYCDFAGYSNIARGLARCMGIDIMCNFKFPFFATNPRDLWRRWHISLSSWIRDYLFKPLGGYSQGMAKAIRNILIVFLLGGLWHGANWTFVVWGLYHAVLLIIYALLQPFLIRWVPPKNLLLNNAQMTVRVIFFFHLLSLGFLIFRAQSFEQISSMSYALFFNFQSLSVYAKTLILKFIFYTLLLSLVEYFQFKSDDTEAVLQWSVPVRTIFYFICLYAMLIFGVQGGEQFYYFQF